MSTAKPSYRRPLSDMQADILNALYRFRFATTSLLVQDLNAKSKIKMNERLSVLLQQEYIGRKYEPEYRLLRKHASYHLMPKGIKALKELSDSYSPVALRNAYKDRSASDRFINHWLGVYDVYCRLKAQYGERIRFFTKAELVRYEYFPQPPPDGYVRLVTGNSERQFIIDLQESSNPVFAAINRAKQYAEYAEDTEWESATNTDLPTILLICDSGNLQRKLLTFVGNELDDDLDIKVTTPQNLKQSLS